MMATVQKAFSLRVLFMAILFGALCGGIASLAWDPLAGPVGITGAVLAWLAVVSSKDTAAVCPYCSKRVKIGATVCHHCGRDATA